MINHKTVHNEYMHDLLRGTLHLGFDLKPILKKAGIPVASYYDADARIDGRQLHSLVQVITQMMDDVMLGSTGSGFKQQALAALHRLYARSKTLGGVWRERCAFWSAIRHDFEATLTVKSSDCHAEILGTPSVLPISTNYGALLWFTYAHRFDSWLIGKPISYKEVVLTIPLKHRGDDQAFLPFPTAYGQRRSKIVFDCKILGELVIRSEEDILNANKTFRFLHQNDLFAEPYTGAEFTQRVENLLLHAYENYQTPSLDNLASELAVSAATLRYRLRSEGQQFQQLKDKIRLNLAKQQLVTTSKSIFDVANKVGFTETAAFIKAFKKWAGVTPSEYRTRYRGS